MARRPGAEELLPGIGRKPLPGLQGSARDPARPGGGWGAAGFSPGSSGDGGPSEVEELQALPLRVLEVGFAPGRRAAIFSPGRAGDRVHLGMGNAGSSTQAPPTGRKDAAVFFLW